ncbi:MAG: hypothetical protein RL115_2032 [Bacteroidota bacterium]
MHENEAVKENDTQRERGLKEWGYTIIRITNNEVVANVDLVLKKIEKKISELVDFKIIKDSYNPGV